MKHVFLHLIVSMLVLLLLAGSVQGADPVIRFAYQPSVAGASLMVADNMGMFAAAGLKVECKILASGPLVNEALASGSAQLGIMGDVPSVIAVSSGLPLTIVATIGGGAERERVMIPTNSPIKTVHDLVGKKVGVTFGSSAQAGWYRLAEKYGIPVSQVKLMNMQPTEIVEALATRQIDAAVTWEPTPTIIEARGIGKELVSLSTIGNTFPFQVLANNKFLQTYPELMVKVLQVLAKAAAFIREQPAKAAELIAQDTGLTPELALKAMKYHFFSVGLPTATYSSLKTTAEFLLEYKSIKQMPNWDKAIDEQFVYKITAKG